MTDGSYRLAKETFHTGHSGSSLSHTFALTLPAVLAWVLHAQWVPETLSGPRQLLFECVLFCLPMLLMTFDPFASQLGSVIGCMIALASVRLFVPKQILNSSRKEPATATNNESYLTMYRASQILLTAHTILACDFPAFPRFLSKTEYYGVSLMDVGVGSFVFAAGLSARPSTSARILRRNLPLIALGLVRLVMVKGTDYAEHTSEYGVHWNFFFTLALQPILLHLTQQFLPSIVGSSAMLFSVALLLSGTHQILLSCTNLGSWALADTRTRNILSQNKEGLVSILGYFCIYLFAAHVTRVLQYHRQWQSAGAKEMRKGAQAPHRPQGMDPDQKLLRNLMQYCAFAGLCLAIMLYIAGLRPSRRIANLSYVLWIVTFNLLAICLFLGTQIALSIANPPSLHASIQKNPLIIFLLSNVLTGAVNLSMQTIYTSDPVAFAVMSMYNIIICFTAYGLASYRIRLTG